MGISTDDPDSIIRLGTIHSWLFRISLWVAPIFSLWAISTIVRHDTDIAVLKMQITMMQASSGGKGVSQSVNVGQTKDDQTELVDTARDYVTTADIAAREHVSERAVVEWINEGRIVPQPTKTGKAWTIARNFRILPQDPEECGEVPQD